MGLQENYEADLDLMPVNIGQNRLLMVVKVEKSGGECSLPGGTSGIRNCLCDPDGRRGRADRGQGRNGQEMRGFQILRQQQASALRRSLFGSEPEARRGVRQYPALSCAAVFSLSVTTRMGNPRSPIGRGFWYNGGMSKREFLIGGKGRRK